MQIQYYSLQKTVPWRKKISIITCRFCGEVPAGTSPQKVDTLALDPLLRKSGFPDLILEIQDEVLYL